MEGVSRQNSSQLGKAVSVSRRPLPAILPKTVPPKPLSTVSSPGRKLASILPAPAKSTSSSLPNPMIVPVVVSSGSSPIPIAPSPRPLQPYTASLASSVMNKVTTVSVATGQSATMKRYVITRHRVCFFPGSNPVGNVVIIITKQKKQIFHVEYHI